MSKIQVLFQNDDFLAVNKPPGISVHNNEDPENLLVLLEKQLEIKKLYPVHRLDKETSGIQLLSTNSESAAKVAEEFQKKSVKKIYCGVLRGQLKSKSGIWTKSLTDKAEGRRSPEGLAKSRVPCETRFHVLQEIQYFTLCEFELITGRQHQIRKHTALTNHPIVGDPRYGEPKYNEKIIQMYKFDRMFLHCSRIEILGHIIQCNMPDCFTEIMTERLK